MLKIIDNFSGRLTRQTTDDMNSGMAKYATTFGNDPFTNPSNLQWFEQPVSIVGTGSNAIGGPIMAAKVRLESNTTNVYAIDDLIKLYKIKVNDTSTNNPNSDSPSVIHGIFSGGVSSVISASYGSSLQFYGSTEKIFVGTDERIFKVNFDGSTFTTVTNISSVTTNVPRPSAQFLGKMYWGNGNNLIEIDSTETVTSYAKFPTSFGSGTYVRDLDVSPDGNYLQITVSKNNSASLDQFNSDASAIASSEAYKFYWNGTDTNPTSSETYPGYSLTANTVFGAKSFTLGTDLNGSALYDGSNKIWTLPNMSPPNFGASFSTGNLLGFATTEYNNSVIGNPGSVIGLQASGLLYGQYDNEVPAGLFRMFRQTASPGSAEVMQVPVSLSVSNLTRTYQAAGYPSNIIGSGKLYFSVSEDAPPSVGYKLYKFMTAPTGSGTAIGGVYETQQETSLKLFRSVVSRKFKPTQIRFYLAPLVANNSFQIDIIGSDGNPMSGGSQTFTVGVGDTKVGDDFIWYTPQTNPTYSMGIRITNLGTANWTGEKLEIEYEEFGV